MKRKLTYFALFVLIFTALGCTHNNGDIGPLFGMWRLESVTRPDGTQESREWEEYWAFQNTTVRVSVVGEHETKHDAYGNWRLEDNTLFLDFPDDKYAPYPSTGLPRSCSLQVMRLTKGELVLRADFSGDTSLIYTLKKW